MFETLERANAVGLAGQGMLTVTGTESADTISINRSAANHRRTSTDPLRKDLPSPRQEHSHFRARATTRSFIASTIAIPQSLCRNRQRRITGGRAMTRLMAAQAPTSSMADRDATRHLRNTRKCRGGHFDAAPTMARPAKRHIKDNIES